MFSQNFNGLVMDSDARFWNGEDVAATLTEAFSGDRMPDKGKLPCVITETWKGFYSESEVGQTPEAHEDQHIICAHETGKGFWQGGDIAGTLRAEGENRPSRPSNIICVHGSQDPISNTTEHANEVNRNNGLENCVLTQINAKAGTGTQEELAYTQNTCGVMGVASRRTIRRLLPVECERLMGFPDNWTRIPWKGKPEEKCPDSPRYKACGNSMCVNVMRWIGKRIDEQEKQVKR